MPKPLKPKTFNIMSTYRLSIIYTFRTYKDINLGFGWFGFGASESFWLGTPLSLEIQLP